MSRRMILGGVAVGLLVLAACQSSSSSSTYDGPHTTDCSNGPPLAGPPYGMGSTLTGIPQCVPRCGGEQKYSGVGGYFLSLAALPSGSCAHDGEMCEMAAGSVTTCPGRSQEMCNLSEFECRCANGNWQCITTSQGAGICLCDTRPGQADAATLDAN